MSAGADASLAAADVLDRWLLKVAEGALTVVTAEERRLVRRVEGASVGLRQEARLRKRPLAVESSPVSGLRMIGYTRVSSDEQARSGLGLRAQRSVIRAACERNEWTLVEIKSDDGESGKSLARPALHAALEAIVDGAADGLVVSKLDRATRSVQDFAALLDWFTEAEATFVACDLQIDTSTPGGRLVANIFVSVAEWEAGVIGDRTREGMAALRAQGRAVSRPAAADRPDLAERIAAMRKQGMAYQAIADTLNAEGVPTLRGGAEWRVSSVQAAAGYRRPPARRKHTELPTLGRRRRRRRS